MLYPAMPYPSYAKITDEDLRALYAFFMVAIAVMMLRKREPNRKRPFRTPALWLIGPLTIAGTLFLFFNLPFEAMIVLPVWGAIGLVIYYLYGYRHSHLGKGIVEVHEPEIHDIEPGIPGIDDEHHPHRV